MLNNCPDRDLRQVGEMVKPMASVDFPTIKVVELSKGEEAIRRYKRYEVPLKPGTDTKQLLAELNKNEVVQWVAIVKPMEESEEDVDAAICVLL